MKKKIVAVLACLAMVFGMFGANVQDAEAYVDVWYDSNYALYANTSNVNEVINQYSFGEDMAMEYNYCLEYYDEDYIKEYFSEYGFGMTVAQFFAAVFGTNAIVPGSVLKAGEKVAFADTEEYCFEDSYCAYMMYMSSSPEAAYGKPSAYSNLAVKENVMGDYMNNPLFIEVYEDGYNYYYYGVGQKRYVHEDYGFTVQSVDDVTAWKVESIVCFGDEFYIILVPITDYSLITTGNTTTWVDYKGNVIWTVTEEEDKISASLSDWGAVKADTVKAWNESGKALSITYKYNGYTVAINVPAGELTDTGAEWYGPEYLAAVNQKYVVVKDSTGLVVPNDRIYKK